MYFDGLNDNEPENGKWRPANVKKRYYSRNSNILVALYGIGPSENRMELLGRTLDYEGAPQISPYFMFYTLKAINL